MTDPSSVNVPADAYEKLRQAVAEVNTGARFVSALLVPATNLVDAVERPDEGDDVFSRQPKSRRVAGTVSAAPVGEPLCRCGHDKAAHEYEYSPVKGHCSHGGTNGVPECRCARYMPPVPVSDEAEAPKRLLTTDEERDRLFEASGHTSSGEGWSALIDAVESILAARLAGKEVGHE